jgi:hypothetical protein
MVVINVKIWKHGCVEVATKINNDVIVVIVDFMETQRLTSIR